jgi:hypothetical protein
VDADDDERLVRQLAFQRRQHGQRVQAVDSGVGPEVEQHHAAEEVARLERPLDVQPDGVGGQLGGADGDAASVREPGCEAVTASPPRQPQSVTRGLGASRVSTISIGCRPCFLNLFRVFADENSVENGKHPWRPLGQMLVERGLIDEQQLENALREHASSGEPIGSVLVSLEYIPEETLRHVLLEQCGLDMTRQEGFGSGLLGELERRNRGRAAAREHAPAPEPPQERTNGVAPTPAAEPTDAPEPVLAAAAPDEQPEKQNGAIRETVSSSIDALLETFEERSRALTAELAAMRQLLHEIAG